jgi:formate dehydrogenase subunit delta
MSHDKLIYMANQIATFFSSQPGTDQAERVAAHIKDFWEPRMRDQFFDMIEGRSPMGIAPLPMVRDAARHLKSMA